MGWCGLRRPGWRPDLRRGLLLGLVWLLVTLPVSVALFLGGSRSTVLAGHDAELRPTLDGYATLDLGPLLPNFRIPTRHRLGADIDLGATELTSYDQLLRRYAFIASQPEGQIDKVRSTLLDLAVDSGLVGGLLGFAGPGLVLLVGRRRWAELMGPWSLREGTAAGLVVVVALGATWVVHDGEEVQVETDTWEPLSTALPELTVPAEVRDIQIEAGLITRGTRRLVDSAVDTYRKSLEFYRSLAEEAPALAPQLRRPQEGETVAVLVSDRHDNIGMDPVARAVADAGGATLLFDAGDDTSTGSSWEGFSLESLDQAFEDYDDRYAVAGNHDNGDFVGSRLGELGFTMLDGEVVDAPGDIRLIGASDVRSSGLGSWRDERGVTFDEQRTRLADAACEQDAEGNRVSTMLVHDANVGSEALERGCVDLVLGGHLHVQQGPSPVVAANGRTGYSYTTGTTGGAAYAIAIGSKLRREAQVTLVTYRDGRPIGVQPVTVSTTGTFSVGEFTALEYENGPAHASAGAVPESGGGGGI